MEVDLKPIDTSKFPSLLYLLSHPPISGFNVEIDIDKILEEEQDENDDDDDDNESLVICTDVIPPSFQPETAITQTEDLVDTRIYQPWSNSFASGVTTSTYYPPVYSYPSASYDSSTNYSAPCSSSTPEFQTYSESYHQSSFPTVAPIYQQIPETLTREMSQSIPTQSYTEVKSSRNGKRKAEQQKSIEMTSIKRSEWNTDTVFEVALAALKSTEEARKSTDEENNAQGVEDFNNSSCSPTSTSSQTPVSTMGEGDSNSRAAHRILEEHKAALFKEKVMEAYEETCKHENLLGHIPVDSTMKTLFAICKKQSNALKALYLKHEEDIKSLKSYSDQILSSSTATHFEMNIVEQKQLKLTKKHDEEWAKLQDEQDSEWKACWRKYGQKYQK